MRTTRIFEIPLDLHYLILTLVFLRGFYYILISYVTTYFDRVNGISEITNKIFHETSL